jgi:hypothetical protein
MTGRVSVGAGDSDAGHCHLHLPGRPDGDNAHFFVIFGLEFLYQFVVTQPFQVIRRKELCPVLADG